MIKVFFRKKILRIWIACCKKGTVAFPLTNSWYTPAFYIGNGCTLFGDGTDESKGVDFVGEKAVSVTEYLVDLAANPNFKIDANGSGLAGLRDRRDHQLFFRVLGMRML